MRFSESTTRVGRRDRDRGLNRSELALVFAAGRAYSWFATSGDDSVECSGAICAVKRLQPYGSWCHLDAAWRLGATRLL